MSAGSIGQQIINGTYGLDNRPPTAYEELKAWCEKHLGDTYRIETIPETVNYYTTMYIVKGEGEIFYAAFDAEGYFIGMSSATWDEFQEHIQCYEEERQMAP